MHQSCLGTHPVTQTFSVHMRTKYTHPNNVPLHAKSWRLTTAAPEAAFVQTQRSEQGFHRGAGFYVSEQKESPSSLLLSPLNPMVCYHPSPTCLFPSYRPRRLPVSPKCLLYKVTAEDQRWERAVLSFPCSSLTVSSPGERLHLRTILKIFRKLHSRFDLEWNFSHEFTG